MFLTEAARSPHPIFTYYTHTNTHIYISITRQPLHSCLTQDPLVFLTEATEPGVPPLEVGTIRRCLVTSNSLFDLEATPVA